MSSYQEAYGWYQLEPLNVWPEGQQYEHYLGTLCVQNLRSKANIFMTTSPPGVSCIVKPEKRLGVISNSVTPQHVTLYVTERKGRPWHCDEGRSAENIQNSLRRVTQCSQVRNQFPLELFLDPASRLPV